MFIAEIIKGFRFQEIQAVSLLEKRLGIQTKPKYTRKVFKVGQKINFATHAEYKSFRAVALSFDGDVKCIGVPRC